MTNIVKKSKAEFELARRFDDISNFMDRLLVQKHGKQQVREVVAADGCRRLARLAAICRTVVLSGTQDQRRATCIQTTDKVERILQGMGLAEELQVAHQAEEAAIRERASQEVDIADVGAIRHLADATMRGSEAIAAEAEGNKALAIDKYREAQVSLGSMIALGRAVAKLKASIGSDSVISQDVERLETYKEQIGRRMESLAALPEGEEAVPVEEEIQPPMLNLLSSVQKWKMAIGHCAEMAVETGAPLVEPFAGHFTSGMQAAFSRASGFGLAAWGFVGTQAPVIAAASVDAWTTHVVPAAGAAYEGTRQTFIDLRGAREQPAREFEEKEQERERSHTPRRVNVDVKLGARRLEPTEISERIRNRAVSSIG